MRAGVKLKLDRINLVVCIPKMRAEDQADAEARARVPGVGRGRGAEGLEERVQLLGV